MLNSGLDTSLKISGTSLDDLGIKEIYTVTLIAGANGTVSGGGVYSAGSVITITATGNSGYELTQWSDGNTSESRQITVTSNITLTATFGKIDPQWEYVDMGSAGKWMKCNYGATSPGDLGGYYAWGELDTYYTSTGTWKEGKTAGYASSSYTLGEDIYDSSTLILKPEYDLIYQKSGGKFRMATESDFGKLANLSKTRTRYSSGGYGMQYSGNGNTLFIPFSGYYSGTTLSSRGASTDKAYIWSSSRDSSGSGSAVVLYAGNLNNSYTLSESRYIGFNIRGIKIQ